jgi:hypothetical protein
VKFVKVAISDVISGVKCCYMLVYELIKSMTG